MVANNEIGKAPVNSQPRSQHLAHKAGGLFRPEAVTGRLTSELGPIVLARAWKSWVFVSGGAAIATLILAYLFLGSYTKRAAASGLLMPSQGMVRIFPATSGVVTERRVVEGQQVHKGEVLFVVSDERRASGASPSERLSQTHTESLALRRASLARALESVHLLSEQTQRGLRERLESLDAEMRHNAQEIEIHTRRVAAATSMLERHRILAREHFISEAGLQDKEDQLEGLRAQLIGAQRQKYALSNSIASVRSELRQTSTRADGQIEELERDLSSLTQDQAEAHARDHLAVTAPMDGIVTAITAQIGQPTGSQALATLLPDGAELVAQLFAPSRVVGFVQQGQSVRLRYQAYPYQKFGQYGGVVTEVSRSPLQPSELSVTAPLALASQEGLYRITVKLDSQSVNVYDESLKLIPGMALEADIEQERRRLIEWVLEPLAGLRKLF